jgi:hypothetical protein
MKNQMTGKPPEQARAQQNTRDYLTDDGRLANPARTRTQQPRHTKHQGNVPDNISGHHIQAHRQPPVRR